MNIAHDQGDGFLGAAIAVRAELTAKTKDAKFAPARGKVSRGELLNRRGPHSFIIAGWSDIDGMTHVSRAL